MAPNKVKPGAHNAQPQPSDYETDAPPLNIPQPPRRSIEELNYSVLHRHYPDLKGIHYVAGYTVLYSFGLESHQWEKVGVEGSMFLCELHPSPAGAERFAVIILNRRGLENFKMEIMSPEAVEISEDYIILHGDQVYGLWVFSEPETSTAHSRDEAKAKIQELAARAKESQDARERETDNDGTDSDQVDTSVPMGRQLSLRELFGQQREQDAAWSVHDHHSSQSQAQTTTNQAFVPTPSPQPGQTDVLSQLFLKAKQNYNGMG